MNIVAILGAVDLQIFLDFSRIGAQLLTVILRMIKLAHLRALVELTIRSCSVLEPVLSIGTEVL